MRKTLSAVGRAILIAVVIAFCCGSASQLSGRRGVESSFAVPSDTAPATGAKPEPGADVRTLQFSGYDWAVKTSRGRRVGPGNNSFSDSEKDVWVDDQGRLHLRISHEDGRWHCAEVISKRTFGYGTYRFYLDGVVDNLDANVVLGLFTWSDEPAYAHREIDIEISRWGQPAAERNAQFVIQPYTRPQNIVRFAVPPGIVTSTHCFEWRPDRVVCQSIKGQSAIPPETGSVIHQRTFTQGIPKAGGENARMNLWLTNGRAPREGKEVEVVIARFEFLRSAQ
jgi:hypothetical protein